MNEQRYFRQLVLRRLESGKPASAGSWPMDERDGSQDALRFRRMAECRKRQMFDRLLIDDRPVSATVKDSMPEPEPHD